MKYLFVSIIQGALIAELAVDSTCLLDHSVIT